MQWATSALGPRTPMRSRYSVGVQPWRSRIRSPSSGLWERWVVIKHPCSSASLRIMRRRSGPQESVPCGLSASRMRPPAAPLMESSITAPKASEVLKMQLRKGSGSQARGRQPKDPYRYCTTANSNLTNIAHCADAAVPQVVDLVAGHLGVIFAEEGPESHEWRRPLFHPCRDCLEPVLAFRCRVMHVHNLEAGTCQERLHGIGCGQMTDGWLARPWHREQHLAPFALQDVVDPETAAAFEHPSRLRIHLIFGRNVHRHVNGHRRIEVRIGKRQGGRVALLEGHTIA